MYRFLGHQVFLTISQEINKRQDGVQSKQRANLELLPQIRKIKFAETGHFIESSTH